MKTLNKNLTLAGMVLLLGLSASIPVQAQTFAYVGMGVLTTSA